VVIEEEDDSDKLVPTIAAPIPRNTGVDMDMRVPLMEVTPTSPASLKEAAAQQPSRTARRQPRRSRNESGKVGSVTSSTTASTRDSHARLSNGSHPVKTLNSEEAEWLRASKKRATVSFS